MKMTQPNEFTIETAVPPGVNNGKKSELRRQIQALKVNEVLRYRPPADVAVPSHLHSRIHNMAREMGRKMAVRKVDGGFDIYRTA